MIKEYLSTLQKRQEWQRGTRGIRSGDVVFLANEKVQRGQWPLGVVVDIQAGRDGHVRSCMVITSVSQIVKPITKKLCLLEVSDLYGSLKYLEQIVLMKFNVKILFIH